MEKELVGDRERYTECIGMMDFYQTYTKDYRDELTQIKNSVRKLSETRRYLVDKLSPYKESLAAIGVPINILVGIQETVTIKKLDKINILLTTGGQGRSAGVSFEDLIRTTRSLLAVNKLISRAEKRISVIKEDVVNRDLYKQVLNQLNIGLEDAILNQGYCYTWGSGIGHIKIIRKERNHRTPVVNWGESNKLKEQLIAEGKLPYKAIKDETGKKIGDNGGEPWFVYFTNDVDYWWGWNRDGRTPNLVYYSFIPGRIAKENLNVTKKNPVIAALYTE